MKTIGGKKFVLRSIYGKREDGKEVCMSIALNSDSRKPVFVYYEGMDTGFRSTRIGDAERYLRKTLAEWEASGLGTDAIELPIDYLEVSGCSEWNNHLIREQYGIKEI